jgi:hypothetical protein
MIATINWTGFATNPWVGFIGSALGVAGIILSIIFYLRSRRVRRPTYLKESVRWYDGQKVPHTELQMTFRGRPVRRFTITHLAFWNAGNETFRASDFAPSSPLRLRVPDSVEVFDIRITGTTAPEIGASLEGPSSFPANTQKELPVRFHYMDPNDGFCLQLIHDGESGRGVEFIGKLPGVSEFCLHRRFDVTRSSRLEKRLTSAMFSSTGLGYRWIMVPLITVGLGGLGLWTIYCAIFRQFHWYQIGGFFCTIYLLGPLILLSQPNPPKALRVALLSDSHDEA